MAENQYYDEHTLYIHTGKASKEQLSNSITQAIRDVNQKLGRVIDCRFRINIVMDREGNSYGFAFVFLTNSEVYHMLLGRNPDGTDRVEYRDDPSWVAPKFEVSSTAEPKDSEKPTTLDGWASTWNFGGGSSWADIVDEEEEEQQRLEDEKNKWVAPKVRVELPTLMTLPPYTYQVYNDSGNLVDEIGYFGVSQAYVSDVDSKYSTNVLRAQDVPTWMNEGDIKREFAAFAQDQTTVVERFVKGVKKNDTYPFVNIVEDTRKRRGEDTATTTRIAFVTFDPFTKDAQFALHMMKKTVIKKKVGGKNRTATLVFNLSYKTERLLKSQNNHRNEKKRTSRPPAAKKVVDGDGFEVKSAKTNNPKSKVQHNRGKRDRSERRDRTISTTSNPFDMLGDE